MGRRARLDETPLLIAKVGRPGGVGLDLLAEYLRARLDTQAPTPTLTLVHDEPSGPVSPIE